MDWKTWLRNKTIVVSLTDWLLMAFTGALTVLGGLQALEMHRQGRDTHTLAEQAVRQSAASEKQATIATATFLMAYKPNVEAQKATLIQQPGGAMVYINFANSGTQTALGVHAEAAAETLGTTPATRGQSSKATISSEAPFPPGRTSVLQIPITRQGVQPIFDGFSLLVVRGTIAFRAATPPESNAKSGDDQTCFRFVYDAASRTFSPNLGC